MDCLQPWLLKVLRATTHIGILRGSQVPRKGWAVNIYLALLFLLVTQHKEIGRSLKFEDKKDRPLKHGLDRLEMPIRIV